MNYITLKIFWALLKTDLTHVRHAFKDNAINLFVWATCTIFINVYVMQKMGLSNNYGNLIVGSIIVTSIWFQMISHIFMNVADYCGDRYIQYHFTLPISNTLIFIKSMCAYTVSGFIAGTLGLLICKIMMFNTLSLSAISLPYFVIALFLSSAFFSSFTLWITSITKNPSKIGNAINRIIFPLWFLGGFLFPWMVLYDMLPTIGIITLLNPYVHMTESLRVATVGQEGFLPFWPSCITLIIMTVGIGSLGIKKLKKRLDFI